MEQILQLLQTQITPILIAFVAYGVCHVANILLGIGIATYGENKFEMKIFLDGLLRGIFVMVGCVLAIVVVNMLTFLVGYGIDIDGIESTINYITVVMTLGVATVAKLTDVLNKLLKYTGVIPLENGVE